MSQATAPLRAHAASSQSGRLALAVADAGWFTTENLFRAVDPGRADTLLLQCMDFVNARNKRIPPWSWLGRTRKTDVAHWERRHILPPGWMSRFPEWGMTPISRSIRGWRRSVGGGPLALVMTYPQYLTIRDQVRPEIQVYYNVDDYRLYWPGRAGRVEELEHQAVRQSDLTVCVAQFRADELRRAVPEAADRIIHLPHGAPEEALAPEAVERPTPAPGDIAHLPGRLIGYVGSLEDRVDWTLLDRVAQAFPQASIVLVGKIVPGEMNEWREMRERCLARPNVHALGWRPQAQIHGYNRSFDVALIPYATDHPFNIACCPTKIMDSLASARPVVSTALPECRLHEGLMHVVEDTDSFLSAIESILKNGSDDGRGLARLDWARANTCAKVVAGLLDRIEALAGRA